MSIHLDPPNPNNKRTPPPKYSWIPSDVSNNRMNPLFIRLQHSKTKNNSKVKCRLGSLREKSVYNSGGCFSMKLKSILDKLEREREVNRRKVKAAQHLIFRNTLDQGGDPSANLAIVPRTELFARRTMDQLIAEINEQYGTLRTDADIWLKLLLASGS